MNAGFSLLPDIVAGIRPAAITVPRRRRIDDAAYPTVRVRQLAPREVLFAPGDPTGPLHEITRGTVLVLCGLDDGRRQIVDIAGPGRLLGLGATDRHRCTAVAVEPTVVSSFDRDIGFDHPIVAGRINRAALAEIDRLRDLALSLGRKTAIERLASFFAGLVDDDTADAAELVLPIGRGEIADHLGLTLETVSRTIGRLKRAGLLVEERGDVVRLPDRRRLRAIADGAGDPLGDG
jgi:CRP/FNR family transcriptional regulator